MKNKFSGSHNKKISLSAGTNSKFMLMKNKFFSPRLKACGTQIGNLSLMKDKLFTSFCSDTKLSQLNPLFFAKINKGDFL